MMFAAMKVQRGTDGGLIPWGSGHLVFSDLAQDSAPRLFFSMKVGASDTETCREIKNWTDFSPTGKMMQKNFNFRNGE